MPYFNLNDGEVASREMYIEAFRQTQIYQELKSEDSIRLNSRK
jgi:hypothetical protein